MEAFPKALGEKDSDREEIFRDETQVYRAPAAAEPLQFPGVAPLGPDDDKGGLPRHASSPAVTVSISGADSTSCRLKWKRADP
jgi:hypothetical protein